MNGAASRAASAASTDTLSGSADLTGRVPPSPFLEPPTGPVRLDPAPAAPPGVRYALRVVRHHWKPILLVGAVGAVLALAAVDRLLPPPRGLYSTSALIRVEPTEPLPGAARSTAPDARTQAELVKAGFVLRSAVRDGAAAELPAVRKDPDAVVRRLTAELKADPVGPQIVRITLAGSDPAELPVLVNAVKDAYLRETVDGELTRRGRRREYLEAAYAGCEKRLRDRRKELAVREAKGEAGATDDRLAFEKFALLQRELFRIELDLHRARIDKAIAARPAGEVSVPETVVAELAEKDPVVRQARTDAEKLDARIAHWERTATDLAVRDKYHALRAERDALRASIDARVTELRDRYAAAAAAAREEKAARFGDREAKLAEEEKLIRGLVVRGWDELNGRATGDQDAKLLRYEVERLEELARQVLGELEGLRLEAAAAPRSATLQEAGEPVEKRGSFRAARLGLAAVGPFALVIGCLVVWEVWAGRVYSQGDVRRALGVRVLGALPDLSRQPRTAGPSAEALCTALLNDRGRAAPRSVLVTSAAPREGKTTLARELARAAAAAGRRTLLVDADLFRPTLARAFRLPAGPGLGEVLGESAVAAEAIYRTPDRHLFVLPAGRADPSAFRALAGGGFGAVLADLHAAFDLVVIDASPVLATAQPLALGRPADAVVLAVLCGSSRVPLVADAVRRLVDVGVPVAGVVANRAPGADRYSKEYRPPDPALC